MAEHGRRLGVVLCNAERPAPLDDPPASRWYSNDYSIISRDDFRLSYRECRPLVVCSAETRARAERAEIPTITWQQFLLDGPPGSAAS
jgi:hypothetical protein